MKKMLIMTWLVASVFSLKAKPVDFSLVQAAAGKFAEAKFALERQDATVELAYVGLEGAFYVFNIADKGFVIIAADDAYRPVIGYSNESTFTADNIPLALMDYLNGVAMSINRLRVSGNAKATPVVAAEWESLLKSGELISCNGGKGVDYLCQTKWDQSYPYNYCCPEDPSGSGGHAIVGCLATAMSQLMRFWAMPAQGIGSHCYTHENYGEICADFGNTVYDWANMPNVLDNNASEAEKLATGTLCFHCGVTIDMGYGPDGSEDNWLASLEDGCRRIGRNLNDRRGLIHSFLDCRSVMLSLFRDLSGMMDSSFLDWEIVFELRLNRARMIRIYADVLVITPGHVFSLEFKMKNKPDPDEVLQAAKYVPYLELIFGSSFEAVPALVLTAATDLFEFVPIGNTDMVLPAASGDMLFNVFNEYMGFLS